MSDDKLIETIKFIASVAESGGENPNDSTRLEVICIVCREVLNKGNKKSFCPDDPTIAPFS